MATPTTRRSTRPIIIADYRAKVVALPRQTDESAEPDTTVASSTETSSSVAAATLQLRRNFPEAGQVAEGGTSDGYRYRIEFAAGRYEATYGLLVSFLREQGYANVVIPRDYNELKAFRLPAKLRHQLSLFGDDGYVHNPLKILFPKPAGRRGALVLELFNEADPQHLLKFHRKL